MISRRTISIGVFVVLFIGLVCAPVFAAGGAKSWVYVDERMYPEKTTDEVAAVIEIEEAQPVAADEGDSLIDSSVTFVGNSADTVGKTFIAGADAVGKTAQDGANGIGWAFMAVYGSIFEIDREGTPEYEELEIEKTEPATIERKTRYHPRYHGRVGQWTRR